MVWVREVLQKHCFAPEVIQLRIHLPSAIFAEVTILLRCPVAVVLCEPVLTCQDQHILVLVCAQLGVGSGVSAAADRAVADRRPLRYTDDTKNHVEAVTAPLKRPLVLRLLLLRTGWLTTTGFMGIIGQLLVVSTKGSGQRLELIQLVIV